MQNISYDYRVLVLISGEELPKDPQAIKEIKLSLSRLIQVGKEAQKELKRFQ